MERSPGIVFLLTVAAFCAGAGIPMLAFQVGVREAHGLATALLATGIGVALARLLPRETVRQIDGSVRLWITSVFGISLAASAFTTVLVWATLRGM